SPDARANSGIFLAFQYPVELPGVGMAQFLKAALNAKQVFQGRQPMDAVGFMKHMNLRAQALGISPEMLKRPVNVGFSGGEKKRLEILQLSLLQPSLAILDEADSGLDIDALRTVADGVNKWHNQNNALLIITHHLDLLNLIKPDFVHIYTDGHIVRSGSIELAKELEANGYKNYLEE
ncbi:MAG: Fe-S cluster assembly ATPase SufC, partial [Alphaproteobacteria bacterium]|nr:Fe-S cluster assembly ATPase SufC [Alphaproteobacteria bacterium]